MSMVSTIGERRSAVDGFDGEHKSMMSMVDTDDVAAADGVLGIVPVDAIVGVFGIVPIDAIIGVFGIVPVDAIVGVLGIVPIDAIVGVLGIVPVETIVFVGVRKSIIGCSSCWTILLSKP